MRPPRRLGISPHLYCEPLKGAPETRKEFHWVIDVPARNAISLRERKLDLSFLSPLDYAREGSFYFIVPGVAVASPRGDTSVTIHFRRGVRDVTTLAVDPSSASEIVLARIVLAEQFDLRPQIVPFQGTPESALEKSDALLAVGDESLRLHRGQGDVLDLVEEWVEMTGVPYVHGLWAGRENALEEDEIKLLQRCAAEGVHRLETIAREAPSTHRLELSETRLYLEGLLFDLSPEAEEGLNEFLRYAYYHTILPDVPDLQYFESGRTPGEGNAPPK
jgi:chorismate dehydratase